MPDRTRALEKYRQGAASYDESNRFRRLRQRCVELLELEPGGMVLDAGCGTGLNFPLLQAAVGERGRLIGVDQSPDMLGRARERVAQHGWRNVALIESSLESARVPESLDAVLLFLTHDVMRSPRALENALAPLARGGRVVAAGAKWAPWWAVPVNAAVWFGARKYTTTFEGFSRPWSHLANWCADLRVEPHLRGAMYVAYGTL